MGDEDFLEFASARSTQLFRTALLLTGDSYLAEDLVQETYAKALKGFPSFQPGTNFRAWIYKILRNAFLTSGRAIVILAIPSSRAAERS